MTTLLTTFSVALAATLLLTPGIRRLARISGLVDRPDGHRKLHSQAVPLGGGVVVLLCSILAVGVALMLPNNGSVDIGQDGNFLFGLLASAVVLCAIGLLDDAFGLRGRQKLFGQVVAVSILIVSGLQIQSVQIFDWHFDLGMLAIPFTVFWLLGAINALNLLDGSDGLATGVGIVLSLSLALMALMTGHESDAIIALAIVGSLVGFLYYNYPPASIFLGDAGSMLIGLVLGALAIRGALKGPATITLAAPMAIWAIPIFDASMAILRRKLTGRSIYTTDRAHLHHCMQQRGYSASKTASTIGLLCAVTATGALVSVAQHNELLALGSVTAVIGTLIVTRFFGHGEILLLIHKINSFLLSLIPMLRTGSSWSQPVSTRVQGTREWETPWKTLISFAERFDLSTVELHVTVPAIQEDYHASWQRKQKPNGIDICQTDIPLIVGQTTVGRLKLIGVCHGPSIREWMDEVIAGLEPFESQMQLLLDDLTNPIRPSMVTGPQRHTTPAVGMQTLSRT